MSPLRRGALLAVGLLGLGTGAMAADALDGLWVSDGVPSGGGAWQWTLRLQGQAVTGEAERQTGALPVQRWRLRGQRQGKVLRVELLGEPGRPGAKAQGRCTGPERFEWVLTWPDGLSERIELIRP